MAQSLEREVLGVAISMMILPLPFVLLRFYARKLKKVKIASDDWILLLALAMHFTSCVLLVVATTVGNLGHHEIFGPDGLPVVAPARILSYKMQYADQILALFADGLTKISILLLYRRIFEYRTFRIITTVWSGVIVMWTVGYAFATIFQCSPINTFWTQPFAEATPGKCVNIYALYLSTAITDLLTDVLVLILPVPAVFKLQMPLMRKISVAGIFLLGTIVLVFGAIRIQDFFAVLAYYEHSVDLSYISPQPFYWTLAETSVGIVCACLPTIAPVFSPEIKGSLVHDLISMRCSLSKWCDSAIQVQHHVEEKTVHFEYSDSSARLVGASQ